MKVLVLATPLQPKSDLHHYDKNVGGTYEVELMDDLAPEDIPSAALDGFHDSIAVKVLDDFNFTVHDADTGVQLHESGEHDDYELAGECSSVTQISELLNEKCVRALKAAASSPSL